MSNKFAMFLISMLIAAGMLLLLLMMNLTWVSGTSDAKDDVYALPIYPNRPVPEVGGYHDILSASVRMNGGGLLFSIEVADSIEHYREGYEVVYIWSIECITQSLQKREYKLIVPYFPEEQGLSVKGWYLALFDASSNEWLIPMLKIDDGMKGDRVDVDLDRRVIGSPVLIWWSVDVMVNVDTHVHGQPDYLMDSAPDNGKVMMMLPPL